MGYLTDEITEAAIYTRPKQSGIDLVGHWGIVVSNKSGRFLVHNMPKTGTVATPASDMSSKWKVDRQLEVKQNKTIHGMFKSTGLAAYLPQGLLKYLTQGLCTGSTMDMAGYLSK